MPQFDQFSFFTQVSWFLFLFFSFYFLFIYLYLPKICYNLKFRKKKINFNNLKKNQIIFEKINIILTKNTINKFFFLKFTKGLQNKIKTYIFNKKNNKYIFFKEKIQKESKKILFNNFLVYKKIFI